MKLNLNMATSALNPSVCEINGAKEQASVHFAPKYFRQKASASAISPHSSGAKSRAAQHLSLSPPLSSKTLRYAAMTAGSTLASETFVSVPFFNPPAAASNSAAEGGLAADIAQSFVR